MNLKVGLAGTPLSDPNSLIVKECLRLSNSPEFMSCALVFENNVSHKNEAVSDHTKYVFDRFQELLDFKFLCSGANRKMAVAYFSQRIGRFTRAELLLISSLLHDLGKVSTIKTDSRGITTALGHEKESLKIAKKMMGRFHYRSNEISYILNLIKTHSGYSLRFLDYLNNLSQLQLKKALSSVSLLPEIFFYMIADNENANIFSKYKIMIVDKFLQESAIYNTQQPLKGAKDLGKLIDLVLSQLKSNSKPWAPETRLFHLSEEVGELHDIYLQYSGAKDREQSIEDIEIALNDVLVETMALYDSFGIDLKKSIERISKEYEK